jgi:hypothetical protein
MRTLHRASPGFLTVLSLAFTPFKNGAGSVPSASSIPAYNPPQPPSGVQQYVDATYGTSWSEEYQRHMNWVAQNQPGNDKRSFDQWLSEGLRGNKADDLWKDAAVANWVNTGTFTAPTSGGSGGTTGGTGGGTGGSGAVTPPIDLPEELQIPEVPNTPLTPNLPESLTGGGSTGAGTGGATTPVTPAQGDGALTVIGPGTDSGVVMGPVYDPTKVTMPKPESPVLTNNASAAGPRDVLGYTQIAMPTPMAPVPPVTDRLSEIIQAGRESKRKTTKRKGLLSTLLAGETGGYQGQQRTLLGS